MIICPHCKKPVNRAKWWKIKRKKKKIDKANGYDKEIIEALSFYLEYRNTAGRIAKRSMLSRQTVVKHLEKMIRMGYVEKFKYHRKEGVQRYRFTEGFKEKIIQKNKKT